MKKIIYLSLAVLAGLFNTTSVSAQEKCVTNIMRRQMLPQHPEILQAEARFDSLVHRVQFQRDESDTATLIVPIVFHIIHNYGTEDISDQQVYDEVRILNEDYNARNDTSVVVDSFKSRVGNAHIQFRLANFDPNHNVTNGIDRIPSLVTYFGGENAKLNTWPDYMYMNVWVVDNIGAYVPNGEVLGYAHFASDIAGIGVLYDGVLIRANAVGSIGIGQYAWTLTHELGHTMNLEHPWGNNNSCGDACGDDGVEDTPETAGYCSQCIPFNRSNRCNHLIHENVQNFMDYSDCNYMFTKGQCTRMRVTLHDTSSPANRNNLWNPVNLAVTGVTNNPIVQWLPKADFYAPTQYVCAGDTVKLVDKTWRNGGDIIYLDDTIHTLPLTGIEWTFDDDATPTTSTDSVAKVVFGSSGWHNVRLISRNAKGADTLIRSSYIYVAAPNAQYVPDYYESFDDSARFRSEWAVLNPSNSSYKWQFTTLPGSDAVMMNNFGNPVNSVSEMISPSFDLSDPTQQYLHFSYAAATTASALSDMTDSLQLLYSNNCGATWKSFANLTGGALANDGFNYVPFFANSSSRWDIYNVAIPLQAQTSNVRFKIRLRSSGLGNNVFIDDLNISYATGINAVNATTNVNLFPNPSSSSVQLTYDLSNDNHVKIELFDALGRSLQLLADEKQTAGSHEMTINKEGALPEGLYVVRLTANDQVISKRLIITH